MLGSDGTDGLGKADEFLDEAESCSEGDPPILAFIERERGDLYGNDGKWIEQARST